MVYFQKGYDIGDIPNLDLIVRMAEGLKTAVVITGPQIDRPGPYIAYVNPAFSHMTGFDRTSVIGKSPRILQKGVKRTSFFRGITQALKLRKRFHGVLENARSNGDLYYCEVDITALFAADGTAGGFLAFEREAIRRKGRPSAGNANRFTPLLPETQNEIPGAFGDA